MTPRGAGDRRRGGATDRSEAAPGTTAGGETAPGAVAGGEAAPGTTAGAKAALREEMRRIRLGLSATERARQSQQITTSVMGLPEVRAATTVLAFSSFGSEVATSGLLVALEEAGVTTLLPAVHAGEMHAVQHRVGEAMRTSSYGALEPEFGRPVEPGAIDVVVTPGLAFDRSGGRLGYGRGFYDRFLSSLPGSSLVVGIGFSEQIVLRVPVEEGDVAVDVVVTDAVVIRCAPAADAT